MRSEVRGFYDSLAGVSLYHVFGEPCFQLAKSSFSFSYLCWSFHLWLKKKSGYGDFFFLFFFISLWERGSTFSICYLLWNDVKFWEAKWISSYMKISNTRLFQSGNYFEGLSWGPAMTILNPRLQLNCSVGDSLVHIWLSTSKPCRQQQHPQKKC